MKSFFRKKKVRVVRRLRVRNIRGCSMDKLFQISTTVQSIPGAEPDHYHIEVTGPEPKSVDIPYGNTMPETTITFAVAGDYVATATLIGEDDQQIGGSSQALFNVQAPPVDVNVVSGLVVTDTASAKATRGRKPRK